jgi:hypothetical protein
MDYVFATISRDRANLVKKGKLLLSDALESDKSRHILIWASPGVPTNTEDTILVLGFSEQANINQYESPSEDVTWFTIPKVILDTAEVEITPTAILYYLAELGLKSRMLPSSHTLEDGISDTPVEKRNEVWGPYYMNAYSMRHGDESSETEHV